MCKALGLISFNLQHQKRKDKKKKKKGKYLLRRDQANRNKEETKL
jgi:hypothetical protein